MLNDLKMHNSWMRVDFTKGSIDKDGELAERFNGKSYFPKKFNQKLKEHFFK